VVWGHPPPRTFLKSEACQSPEIAIKFTSCGVIRFLQILSKMEKPGKQVSKKSVFHFRNLKFHFFILILAEFSFKI
jgi:hypothetical protein